MTATVWRGHEDPADQWDDSASSPMSGPRPVEPIDLTVVVFDDRVVWHLAGGTRIREVGAFGREFRVDNRIRGRLWHGNTMCTVSVLEMPIEVIGR